MDRGDLGSLVTNLSENSGSGIRTMSDEPATDRSRVEALPSH